MTSNPILEICAFNIQSCFIAAEFGASRIELCADPLQGGTTPSYGTLQYALEHISIPVFPMIRPRGGNFIYDKHELEIMKKDIVLCREMGFEGIATGILKANRETDVENLKRIVSWAYPMKVTCHKAFDSTPDVFVALEDVINTGCTRILTSGGCKTAIEGSSILAELINQATGRIIIMPGGGVRSSNIAELAKATGANEFHSSALLNRISNHIADGDEVTMLAKGLRINF